MCVCVCAYVLACVRACVRMCESVSEDMSPYCSAHDEWLIMKLCMYVGYHDANNAGYFLGIIRYGPMSIKFDGPFL